MNIEYGDRSDIALARDKQQGIARDNYYRDLNQGIPDQPFAESRENGIAVSDIVKRLVRQGGGKALYYNHQIFWDMDLNDAREQACLEVITPENWDEPITELEQIDINGYNKGHEYEINVSLFQ